jgi:hypothetical protein
MVDYLPLVLTGLGLAASIVYYASVLRNSNKARLREVIFQRAQVYSGFYTEAYAAIRNMNDWNTAEEFHAKYGISVNPDKWSKYMYITRVFNIAGILLQENMADADLIFKLYPPHAVINVWEQFELITQSLRDRVNYPEAYESFEFLYKQAKERYPEITSHRKPWSTNQ